MSTKAVNRPYRNTFLTPATITALAKSDPEGLVDEAKYRKRTTQRAVIAAVKSAQAKPARKPVTVDPVTIAPTKAQQAWTKAFQATLPKSGLKAAHKAAAAAARKAA